MIQPEAEVSVSPPHGVGEGSKVLLSKAVRPYFCFAGELREWGLQPASRPGSNDSSLF